MGVWGGEGREGTVLEGGFRVLGCRFFGLLLFEIKRLHKTFWEVLVATGYCMRFLGRMA